MVKKMVFHAEIWNLDTNKQLKYRVAADDFNAALTAIKLKMEENACGIINKIELIESVAVI